MGQLYRSTEFFTDYSDDVFSGCLCDGLFLFNDECTACTNVCDIDGAKVGEGYQVS